MLTDNYFNDILIIEWSVVNMNKLCLAYIVGNDLSNGEFETKLKQIDFNKLTHISVAFSLIREINGKWLPYITDKTRSGIDKIKAEIKAQKADTKIILSVGGAGADGFCQATGTEEGRKCFTDAIIELVDEFSLDGVDIDWEFPGEPVFGIACCKHCKTDFILLLEELRRRLGSRLLTVAVGSNRYFGIDIKRLGRIVDYVLVMTYDLGVMHSNIYLSKAFVTMWNLLGIPKNKVCIGVPLYGRNVKKLKEDISYCEACKGKISCFLGQSFSNYNGSKWCFDTEKDVEMKASWAEKNGFGGVFCWEITGDDSNRIINAMNSGINCGK